MPGNSSRHSAGCCQLSRWGKAQHNGNITNSHQPEMTLEQKEGEGRSKQLQISKSPGLLLKKKKKGARQKVIL